MPETKQSDKKLIQYLNEAYGKERELETALEAHLSMTDRAPYKKRLQAHLRETKQHARKVEQRIKKLGGTPQPVQAVVGKATAALKGPVHALRGSGIEEKLLKNAKTEYSEEAEEIATYMAIEEFATAVGDGDTAKLAREIRREEEKMARFARSRSWPRPWRGRRCRRRSARSRGAGVRLAAEAERGAQAARDRARGAAAPPDPPELRAEASCLRA